MPSLQYVRQCDIQKTARVIQIESLFDVPAEKKQTEIINVNFDIDYLRDKKAWNIGLIVGPSGAGKTSLAKEFWGPDSVKEKNYFSEKTSLIDCFPEKMETSEIIALLGAVGLNSPPAWIRPYSTLSNGEQFRAYLARSLAEDSFVLLDEFTSVVDRQVAQFASHSLQKNVRRRKTQFVALSCHYDILEWLQPDWVYQPHLDYFERRLLRQRPEIKLDFAKIDRASWKVFAKHHYLNTKLSSAAQCYGAWINGVCVAFTSYLHFPHPNVSDIKMTHRLVVLPDFQGLGIAMQLNEFVGEELAKQNFRYRITSSHPAIINACRHSKNWIETSQKNTRFNRKIKPSVSQRHSKIRNFGTKSFQYVSKQSLIK